MMERLALLAFRRLLLPLYPPPLRREYAGPMLTAFRLQLRKARGRGVAALGRLGVDTLRDVALSRALHRGARLRPPTAPAPRRGTTMRDLIDDLRHGARLLARSPGFTAAAILTLGLGIAASVTMFSGLSGLVLKALPYEDDGALVAVWPADSRRGIDELLLSPPELEDLRAGTPALAALSGYVSEELSITGVDEPTRLEAVVADGRLFDVLGVEAARGRTFDGTDARSGAPGVVVLGHGAWQRLFGADPGVVGRTVEIEGEPRTVVGVMPEGFWFPLTGVEAYLPQRLSPGDVTRDDRFLAAVGRLAPGATEDEAAAQAASVFARLAAGHPETGADVTGVTVRPLLHEIVHDEMRWAIWLLAGTGLFVLLIACVNVASLLMARVTGRQRELGVRTALGAGRLRLLRQVLTENLLLAVGGGVLGTLLASRGIAWIGGALPPSAPRVHEYQQAAPTWEVIAFAVVASLGSLLAFGLPPALHVVRRDLQGALRDGGRGSVPGRGRRLQRSLVVFEVALTVCLLVGAGLLVRSYRVVMATDPGYRVEGALTLRAALPPQAEPERRVGAWRETVDALAALPGVRDATAATSLPADRRGRFGPVEAQGRPVADGGDRPRAHRVVVHEGYLGVIGMTVRAGRGFTAADREGAAPVAVINDGLAGLLFPEGDALGRRLRLDAAGGWIDIVGVVADARNNGLHRPPWPTVYLPLAQHGAAEMSLVVSTERGAPGDLAGPARAAVWTVEPDLPVFEVRTLQRILDERFWGEKLTTTLLSGMALAALLLAVVGLYAVVSASVGRRTREMGLRMALGARDRQVVRLVVRQGLGLVFLGLAIGLLLAFGLSRAMGFLLFGVGPSDAVTWVGAPALLLAVAWLACRLPARRATRVDPAVALRAG